MEPESPGEMLHEFHVANDLAAIDLDDEPPERWVIRHLPTQVLDRFRFLEERDR